MSHPPILCYTPNGLRLLYNNIIYTDINDIYNIVDSTSCSMILNYRIDKKDNIFFKNKVNHFTKFFDRATIAIIKFNFLNNTADYIKNLYYVRDTYLGNIKYNTNYMRHYYLSLITSINCIDACCHNMDDYNKYLKMTSEYGFDTTYESFIEDLNELKNFLLK